MRVIVIAAATALSIGLAGGTAALAAPPPSSAAAIQNAVQNGTSVVDVRWHWRHRHCWWRWGYRHCRWW